MIEMCLEMLPSPPSSQWLRTAWAPAWASVYLAVRVAHVSLLQRRLPDHPSTIGSPISLSSLNCVISVHSISHS